MKVCTPPGDRRLRPRDGAPRCLIEFVAQWLWRWRIELFLVYIVVMVTVGVYHEMTT